MVRIIKGHQEDIFGGTFVGNICSAFLFGILTIQVVLYYLRFPQDSKWTRRAVGFLWILVTKAVWWYHIQNHSNPHALAKTSWELSSYQLCTTVASLIVQSFFVSRIWGLCSNIYVVLFLQALVVIQFSKDITLSYIQIIHKWNWAVTAWLAMQAACDAMIAVLMTSLLWYKKTGFKRTDSAINTMVFWTIATGGGTCLLSIIGICVSILRPLFTGTGDFFFCRISLQSFSSVYAISMLANLHMRSRIREQLSAPMRYEDRPSIPLDALTSAQRRAVASHERREHMPPRQPVDLAEGSFVVSIHRSKYEDSPSNPEVRE
ncbi:uncharacterized protein EI90DRAFT_3039205 [Cantharellus anzutake]|uniref:uncharacterized protein n=1 Tax=Cantharellus anzutake TaxID=1750568 RepID=UPI00190328E4|nr:uncharacterized protein EI90DRAFT_3039205 [Cantharellus anzutake]KAF8338796.1 hypothetical protein EI90DRAFT_3039205 [Cantharellus anzutake]